MNVYKNIKFILKKLHIRYCSYITKELLYEDYNFFNKNYNYEKLRAGTKHRKI